MVDPGGVDLIGATRIGPTKVGGDRGPEPVVLVGFAVPDRRVRADTGAPDLHTPVLDHVDVEAVPLSRTRPRHVRRVGIVEVVRRAHVYGGQRNVGKSRRATKPQVAPVISPWIRVRP